MFENKVAVITGAGSGIGRALATQLAAAGTRLALSDVNAQGLEQTRQLCGPAAQVLCARVDVSKNDEVLAHAEAVKREFGAADFLFNNAGVTLVGTVANTSIEEFEWQLGVNLWGVVYGTKAFLPMMLAQREGCIVNLSSVFGLAAFPTQGAYNITKFGVRGFTECLWRELEGTGVRAVCVHPGGIRTNIERAGRRVAHAGVEEAAFPSLAEKMLVTPPEDCARDIIRGVRRGRRRIVTGKGSTLMYWLPRLFPNRYPDLMKLAGL